MTGPDPRFANLNAAVVEDPRAHEAGSALDPYLLERLG
jgi:hypothetical protein